MVYCMWTCYTKHTFHFYNLGSLLNITSWSTLTTAPWGELVRHVSRTWCLSKALWWQSTRHSKTNDWPSPLTWLVWGSTALSVLVGIRVNCVLPLSSTSVHSPCEGPSLPSEDTHSVQTASHGIPTWSIFRCPLGPCIATPPILCWHINMVRDGGRIWL